MGVHAARTGKMRNAYKILVGKPEGKRLLGRPKRRWEDNIIKDLKKICWEGTNMIHLAQGRDRWRAHVNTGNEPSGSIKDRKFLD
jgi:hypothetical protein